MDVDKNDNYQCICVLCSKTFIGHKREVTCSACKTYTLEQQNTALKAALKASTEIINKHPIIGGSLEDIKNKYRQITENERLLEE